MKEQQLIKLRIFARQQETKDGKRKFISFRTKLRLIVKGEEEQGKQEKWVSVHFNKDVDTKSLRSGTLYIKQSDINAPFVYEVKVKDDKKEYPRVWVKNYEKFVPYQVHYNQDMFVVDDDEESTDEESTDEESTDEESTDELPF